MLRVRVRVRVRFAVCSVGFSLQSTFMQVRVIVRVRTGRMGGFD